jgi:hypothetical protein
MLGLHCVLVQSANGQAARGAVSLQAAAGHAGQANQWLSLSDPPRTVAVLQIHPCPYPESTYT